MSNDDFLSRWSRRKHQARKGEVAPEPPASPPLPPVNPQPVSNEPAAKPEVDAGTPAPLPPIESLNPESDFTGFMKPDVDRGLRNQALKTLFSDPRFNVMDGLDVYIDDYSKPDPLPAGWLEKMTQVARLGAFEPPKEDKDDAAPAAPVEEAGKVEEAAEPAEPEAVVAAKDPAAGEDKIRDT